jgi:hypothetical protein
MKPVNLTEQQREDLLSTINDLRLAVLADNIGEEMLVPTALENAYGKLQFLIDETCVVEE